MIEIKIPGYKDLQLQHLVLDYNGTLALDGKIISCVREMLIYLSQKIEIHVITADTFGNAQIELKDIPCRFINIGQTKQRQTKAEYIKKLGNNQTICIGNGRNDSLMLKEAILGICVIQKDGTATETLLNSEIVCPDIISALELLTNPLRLIATLRG